jgi:hypothetical protein
MEAILKALRELPVEPVRELSTRRLHHSPPWACYPLDVVTRFVGKDQVS